MTGDLISMMRSSRTAGISLPAVTLADAGGDNLLAAPGGEDNVGCGLAHRLRYDDAILCGLPVSQLRKNIRAAGDLDQLGDPADAGDQRIVPFLEIDLWPRRGAGRCGNRGEAAFETFCEYLGALARADQRAGAYGSSPRCRRCRAG